MSIHIQTVYTAALALNNVGVSLLERGHYSQAIECFQDAVSVIKEVTTMRSQQETTKCFPSSLVARIHKAGSCFISGARAKDCNMKLLSITVRESADITAALHEDDGLFNDACTAIAIRIETALCDSESLHLESAIVLQNFAIAYRSLADSVADRDFAQGLYQGAMKLLKFAYALSRQDSQVCLPMLFLIARNLSSCASILNMKCEADNFYSHTLWIRGVLLEADYTTDKFGRGASPAA